MHKDLEFALDLANKADELTLSRFEAADLSIESKPDMTPVSDADKGVERLLREELRTHMPNDAVLGEEYGGRAEFNARQWIIDPIDGTKNFVRGVPVWATLIALLEDGVPTVGVISAPALGRRWYAAHGEGSYRVVFNNDPQLLHVSHIRSLADASLAFSSLHGWEERGRGNETFLELTRNTWRLRGYGDFWNYCMVAEGAVDIAAEPEVSLWDLAAVDILVREAGGSFTDLQGNAGPHGGSAVATNGHLHDQVLEYLR